MTIRTTPSVGTADPAKTQVVDYALLPGSSDEGIDVQSLSHVIGDL
jgi:hypothetical protein